MVRPSVGVRAPPGAAFHVLADASRTRNILLVRFGLGSLRTCPGMRQAEEPQVALGKAVRELRRESGLTQETLAEKTGLSGRTLSAIETGRANPRWSTIHRIAAGLGVSIPEVAKLEEKHNALERRSRK